MTIKVLYFARLRDLIDVTEDFIEAEGTVNDLLEQIRSMRPGLSDTINSIQNGTSDIMLACNLEYITDLSSALPPNSEFAFIPPIGGG